MFAQRPCNVSATACNPACNRGTTGPSRRCGGSACGVCTPATRPCAAGWPILPRPDVLPPQVDVQGVRVFFLESEPAGSISTAVGAEVRECMRRAVQHLRARGLSVQRLPLDGLALEDAAPMSALLMLQLRRVHSVHYDPKRPDSMHRVWPELFRFLTCRSRSTLHCIVAGLLFALARRAPERWLRAYEGRRAAMQARFKELLGEDGVLLYPSMPEPAHRRLLCWHRPLDSSYLMIFNCLGLPVTQTPLGLGSSGRPVGLQVSH